MKGDWRPGDSLDEVSLATRFEVSRTPVREALGQLGAMRLVDRRPNRGAIVAVVTDTHLSSMFEGMAELEGICARLSAERMTADRAACPEGNASGLARSSSCIGAEEDYEAHNTEFHTRLYVGAHSPHIYELATLTRSRLAPFRRAQFKLAGRLTKSWDEHDAIVSAILRGDRDSRNGHPGARLDRKRREFHLREEGPRACRKKIRRIERGQASLPRHHRIKGKLVAGAGFEPATFRL